MAKKKEICPFCGQSFAYLSRHKCKVKERIEGSEDSGKSNFERRAERREEKKKEGTRNLKKEEKIVLDIIRKEKQIFFKDLLKITEKEPIELDKILEILVLQSKIKTIRELLDASWTKNISIIEEIDIKVEKIEYDEQKNDFILDIFSYQPCLICPFSSKCNETNIDQFNPRHCPWLSDWINALIAGQVYKINFDEIQSEK